MLYEFMRVQIVGCIGLLVVDLRSYCTENIQFLGHKIVLCLSSGCFGRRLGEDILPGSHQTRRVGRP